MEPRMLTKRYEKQQVKPATSTMNPKSKEEKIKHDAYVKKTQDTTKGMDLVRGTRALVETAIKDKKIFALHGHYPVLRRCLENRGWLEKTSFRTDNDTRKGAGQEGFNFKAKLLCNVKPNLLWIPKSETLDYSTLSQDQIINHFPSSKCFTTKAGLCTLVEDVHWFTDVDPNSFIPRCYRLREIYDREKFIDDFRQTAARGILKRVSNSDPKWLAEKTTDKGSVHTDIILKSIEICETYLNQLEHNDIDQERSKPKPPRYWEEFLSDYYRVIDDGATIVNAIHYVKRCRSILRKLKAVCPQLEIEGEQNIWIMKPGAKSRGRGIYCKNKLKDIMSVLDYNPLVPNDDLCVVQKYIERPLLIHGTKFDVRQWFMVTDWNPLTIWFYKDCYLRFSSQLYSLKTLDRNIHLCNHAIQKFCKNSPERHPDLPSENMWFDYQFKEYLQKIGAIHAWDEVILPGMKEIIINTMKSAQDKVEQRKNTFQLYGADFMFGENFQPWLIEINGKPALATTTPVNTKLSGQVQEDILRVILDRKQDNECDVGSFELLYKQTGIKIPKDTKDELLVRGVAIRKPSLSDICFAKQSNQISSVMPTANISGDRIKPSSSSLDCTARTTTKPVSIVGSIRNSSILNRPKVVTAWKEEKLKDEVHTNSKKTEFTILQDYSKGDTKQCNKYALEMPVKVKDLVDLKLSKIDLSKERDKKHVPLHIRTKPALVKPLGVKDTVINLDSAKEKLKPLPCILCKGQTCSYCKSKKPALLTTNFPSDLFKRRKF